MERHTEIEPDLGGDEKIETRAVRDPETYGLVEEQSDTEKQ